MQYSTKGIFVGLVLILSVGLILSGCDSTPTGVQESTSPQFSAKAQSSAQAASNCEGVDGTIVFSGDPSSGIATGTLDGDLTGRVKVIREGLKRLTRGVAIGIDKFVFDTGSDDFGSFEGTSDNTVVTFSQVGAQQSNAHVELKSGAEGNLTLNGRAGFNAKGETVFTGEYHGRVCSAS